MEEEGRDLALVFEKTVSHAALRLQKCSSVWDRPYAHKDHLSENMIVLALEFKNRKYGFFYSEIEYTKDWRNNEEEE